MKSLIISDSASLTDVGTVIAALGILAVLAVNIKNLFWPSKPTGQEFVQKQELNEAKTELTKDVSELKSSVENRMNELRTNVSSTFASYTNKNDFQRLENKQEVLATNYRELFDYTHKNVHDMLDKVNAIALRIEMLHRSIDKEMATDRERILERIDQLSKVQMLSIDKLSGKINSIEVNIASLLVTKDGRKFSSNKES